MNLRDRFPHPYTPADAAAYIDRVAGQTPVTSFGIVIGDMVIGGITLRRGDDIERENAEVGYWIGREYWGRGIITEALLGVTGYAFAMLRLRRVFAVPFTRNVASIRALEKAGYTREGTMRHGAVKDGELLDQALFAAYDDHWGQ